MSLNPRIQTHPGLDNDLKQLLEGISADLQSTAIQKGDTGATGPAGADAVITPAAYVDPASGTFAAQLVAALIAAGLMSAAP